MYRNIVLLFIVLALLACNNYNKEHVYKVIADKLRDTCTHAIPLLKKVDTVYLKIYDLTESSISVIQSVEYHRAEIEAVKAGSADSDFYRTKSFHYIDQSEVIDKKRVLGYDVRALVIYTNDNSEKATAEWNLYFDKDFNAVSLYRYVEKVSSTYNESKLILQKYEPLSSDFYTNYSLNGFLKFSY